MYSRCRDEGKWFEVHLASTEGLVEEAKRLDRVLRMEGHTACVAVDEGEEEFIAVLVRGPRPAQALERLMHQAGLFGYCEELHRSFWLIRTGAAPPDAGRV